MVKKIGSDFILSASYTVATFLIAINCFEVVFDDSYDALISNISSGQFTPFSFMDVHYLGYIGIKDLLKEIQDCLTRINVFALFSVLSNTSSLFLLLYIFLQKMAKGKSIVLKHIACLVISLVFIENIVSITHTRFATILCGVAWFAMYSYPLKSKKFLFFAAVFVFGMLSRSESAIGVLLIVGIGFIAFGLNFFKYCKASLVPALSLAILITVFLIERNQTNRFEIKMEPDIEYALSTNRVIPLEAMKNKEDSIRYRMALTGMFIDEEFTDIEFLRGISKNQFEWHLDEIFLSVKNIRKLSCRYSIFPALFLVLAICQFGFSIKKVSSGLRLAAYFVVFNALLIYLDYAATIEDRHFVGLSIVSAIIPLDQFLKLKREKYFVSNTLSLILLCVCAFLTSKQALDNQILVSEDIACITSGMREFENVYLEETVVISHSSYHLLDRKYSFYKDLYQGNKYLFYDGVNYSIAPRNMAYLNETCSCDASKPEQFFEWAAKEEVVFLMEKSRASLIEEYMLVANQAKVEFVLHKNSYLMNWPSCLSQLSIDAVQPMTIQFIP